VCIDGFGAIRACCRLQPVKDTREKQIQLWKELILRYCKHHKCFVVDLEAEFPLFENTSIQSERTCFSVRRHGFRICYRLGTASGFRVW
jgi:hypothetical protein